MCRFAEHSDSSFFWEFYPLNFEILSKLNMHVLLKQFMSITTLKPLNEISCNIVFNMGIKRKCAYTQKILISFMRVTSLLNIEVWSSYLPHINSISRLHGRFNVVTFGVNRVQYTELRSNDVILGQDRYAVELLDKGLQHRDAEGWGNRYSRYDIYSKHQFLDLLGVIMYFATFGNQNHWVFIQD